MTENQDQKTSPSSLSTILLCGILGLCLLMIGGTGYIKYQIDRYETIASAPDMAFTPEQDVYEKTVVALGYSGFLGAAQTFMTNRDRAALGDMRMNLKTAEETITRVGDKAANSARRDMKAILSIYADLITKAEEGGDAMSAGITSPDILRASTALATLETRLQSALATHRMEANASVKGWNLALMLTAWCSLLLLAAVSCGMVLMIRNRKSVPMGSLMQSVTNMAHGDLENPIWGMERSDSVGDLARIIDRARQMFAQLPDVTLQTDEGPTRLKFDGETRSLFQSMMKNMTENFERTQQSALGYTGIMNAQQDMLTAVTTRMNTALAQLQQDGASHGETVRTLATTLIESAQALADTQEKGMAQVGRLVPSMQERIQNMAEVTHLAGTQVTQSLQTLLKSESTLRASATQSQQVVGQLANATNQMGERMFAALNLMQASGKLLNETTDSVKTRFNEAVNTLGRGEDRLQEIVSRAESRLNSTINAEENMAALAARTESSAEKMEKAVNNICERHEGLSEQVVTATHRMESIVASFDAAQRAMSEATTQVRRDGTMINSLLQELRANNDQLLSSVNQNSQTSFSAVQSLAEKSHALMQRLEVQIQQQAQSAETHIEELTSHSKVMAQQATGASATLAQAVTSLKAEQDKLAATRGRFSETITDLGTRFEQQATSTFGKTEQWAAQSFTKLTTIAEQVESVMQRLSMLGQLTGTLGTVAGQLGQLVPTLTQMQFSAGSASGGDASVTVDMEETKALIVKQTEDVLHELQGQWHTAVVQIEAMHDQLAQLVVQQKDQIETRLVVMDKKLRDAATSRQDDSASNEQAEEKQADIMNEIIAAISKINEHVMEIDDVIEDAGLRKEG